MKCISIDFFLSQLHRFVLRVTVMAPKRVLSAHGSDGKPVLAETEFLAPLRSRGMS